MHAWTSGIGHPVGPSLVLSAMAGLSIVIAGVWFGTSDRPFVWLRTVMAGLAAGLVLVAAYALIPDFLRVSRAAIGAIGASLVLFPTVLRTLLTFAMPSRFRWRKARATVGLLVSDERANSVQKWVESSYGSSLVVNYLKCSFESDDFVSQAKGNLVLCDARLGGEVLLSAVRAGRDLGADVRIVPDALWLALGGTNRDSGPGELLPWGADGLGRTERRRAKRRLDMLWSVWVLLFGGGRGVHADAMSRRNAWAVLMGRRTWLGFHGGWEGEERLPAMLPGVFLVGSGHSVSSLEEAKRLDLRYAFDFGWVRDLELLMTLRTD